MSREVRMVTKDWKHPKRQDGSYIALFDSDYQLCADDWDKECDEWNNGIYPEHTFEQDKKLSFSEWSGKRPEKSDYMPEFEDGKATYFMMYETTSEGTPMSPAFETPEELAKWLVDNNASAFARETASYKSWLRIAKGGFCISAVLTNEGLINGVDAFNNMK